MGKEPLVNGDCPALLQPAVALSPFLLHRDQERRYFIISSSAGTPRLTSLAHDTFNLNAVGLVRVIDTVQSAGALTTKSLYMQVFELWCGKLEKLFQFSVTAVAVFSWKCWTNLNLLPRLLTEITTVHSAVIHQT